MPKKIEFKFDIDDKVMTCFDKKGLVVGLFYDNSGNQYNVRTEKGDNWFKEADLTLGWNEEQNGPFAGEDLKHGTIKR